MLMSQQRKISPRWTANNPANAEEFHKMLRTNDPVLQRLKQIMENERNALISVKPLEDYDNPSWSHKQADRQGQLRVYQNILTLLEFVDND